ncbi:unnamed protein product, partial [marine sediment metagenome]
YILAGGTGAWLIKTDARGNKVWDKTFGALYAKSVQQTTDGGYILAGYTWSFGLLEDAWLIKTDIDGNKIWDQTFSGSRGSDQDYAYSVQQTSDGGYILAGEIESYGVAENAWLIKTDIEGNKLWDQTFGGLDGDYAYSVQQTSDGGYILAGGTKSYGAGKEDAWLIKTDAEGNKEWDQTFGGSDYDEIRSVQQTSDGGYILAGYTMSYGAGGYGAWLIKTDAEGNKEWDQTFGGSPYDKAYSVQQTSDGGYILAGTTWSGAGDYDAW